MRSVALRTEPTVRQADAILVRLEAALVSRGASVDRQGLGLRFRMPPVWRRDRFSALMTVTSGLVKVSAGAGERWRVRYDLDFTILRVLAVLLTVVAVIAGWGWPRLLLGQVLVGIWGVLYLGPKIFASRRFDRLVRTSAVEVLERRTTPRSVQQQPQQ